MKHITLDELKQMTGVEGLILQGCGGDPAEWVDGINDLFTKEGILFNGDTFKDVYVFEHDGHTNMLFSMEGVELNVGKLAMWRIASHSTFGGTWLSDYLPNRLGVEVEHATEIERDEPAENEIPAEDKKYPLSAYLVNPQGNHDGWWLGFPTTHDGLQVALKAICIADDEVVICQYYATDIEHLAGRLPDAMSVEKLDELNYMAAKLDVMTEPQREVFEAVLESGRHCGSMKDMINVMENLDSFDLEPAYSPAQLGEHWLDMSKDEYAGAFERIEKSDDPDLRELAAYIECLEKHFDAKSYALERAETEGGCFAKHGYLTEHNNFLEAYRGTKDIPHEYRVFDGSKLERGMSKKSEPRQHER